MASENSPGLEGVVEEDLTGSGPVRSPEPPREQLDAIAHSPIPSAINDLMRTAPFGIYIVDRSLTIVEMNDASQRTAFRNISPAVGKGLSETMHILWPKDTAESIVGQFRRTLETGESYSSKDYIEERADLREVQAYEWALHRIVLPDGEFGVVCYFFDSTELRRTESALRAKEEELQMVAASTPVVLVRLDKELRYTYINSAGAALFDGRKENILGRTVPELLGPENFAKVREHYERVLRGEAVDFETDLKYPRNGVRRMRVHYKPQRSASGEVCGIVASLIDVTDRVAAENALRRQAELIDLSLEAIIAWKPDAGIIEWNKGAEDLYGFTRDEALGKVSHKLLKTAHPEGFDEFWSRLMRDNFWEGELTHTTRDGREVLVESRQQVLKTQEGVVVLETNRDVTEKRDEARRVILLSEIGEIIRTTNQDAELLYRIACTVGRHFNAQRCLFNEIDLENDLEIVHRDYFDNAGSVAGTHKISNYSSVTSADMKAGRTVVNHDSKADPRTSERYSEVYEPAGERSYVAVPLMRDQKWVASLWISCDTPHRWSKADVQLLEMIAERAWLGVEKSRNEAALRSKEAELQFMADTTPIILVRYDKELRYRFINKAGAALFGKTPEEMIGLRMPDVMGEEAFSRIEGQVAKALAGSAVEYDVEVPYPVGTRWMRVSYVPEKDSAGSVLGFIASIADITEVRNANAMVQRDLADMDRLRQLAAVHAAASDLETLYSSILDTAIALMGADCGSLQMYHPESDSLELLAWKGFHEESARYWQTIHSDDPTSCSNAMSRSQRVTVFDCEAEAELEDTETLRHFRLSGIRSMQSTPLLSRSGDLVGIVSTHWKEPYQPTERELGLMDILARQAADLISRKLDDDRLRESDERFRLAQRAGGVGIWDWNISEGRTYWSETTWNFYGEDPDSADPDDEFWTTHLHPEDRERVKQNLVETLASRSLSYRDEFRILRRDGTVLWIESNASVTRDKGGRPTRIFGVNIDITERRLAEERVRASAQQLRLVTDAMPALISYVDKHERFRFANQTYQEWFGMSPESLIGKKVRDVFGAEVYHVLAGYINEALAGKDVRFETELQYQTGPKRFVVISYTPDLDANGKVRGYFALTTDLTDLRRSQEMLRSTEQRVSMMMDTFTDYAIFTLNAKGLVDSWNIGAKLIFGYEESEILGQPGDILYTPEDIANRVPELEMETARNEGRASDERWHMRKDGVRFYASGVMMPLYLGDSLTGYAKIASDLTERHRQQEALERAHNELEVRVAERTRELAESNRALIDEAKARTIVEEQRIQLLHRLVTSQEMERRRIARDLHDHFGQRLTGLRLKIESLRTLVDPEDEIGTRVARLQEISEGLDAEVSFLAWELRPTVLDDLGLVEALRTFVREWSRHTDINGDFQAVKIGDQRFNADVETHLYRIAQEALNNISKHAEAQNVTVMLEKRQHELILIVEDDGTGFDVTGLSARDRTGGGGLGLLGMQERSALIGGELDIESSENGTTIYIRVPAFES